MRPKRWALPASCSSWRPAAIFTAGRGASKEIVAARGQVEEALAEMLDYAKQAKLPLAIEPLHPAYAADRAYVNTTKQALDICRPA